MIRKASLVLSIIILMSLNASAGSLYSSQYSRDQGTIVGAVEIEGKGIYNLVISVNFLRRPQDMKIFKSKEYDRLIDRLSVEWRGVALQRVLETEKMKITDLAPLKKAIESDIDKLKTDLRNRLLHDQNAEIVFSLSDFFLLEPIDK